MPVGTNREISKYEFHGFLHFIIVIFFFVQNTHIIDLSQTESHIWMALNLCLFNISGKLYTDV